MYLAVRVVWNNMDYRAPCHNVTPNTHPCCWNASVNVGTPNMPGRSIPTIIQRNKGNCINDTCWEQYMFSKWRCGLRTDRKNAHVSQGTEVFFVSKKPGNNYLCIIAHTTVDKLERGDFHGGSTWNPNPNGQFTVIFYSQKNTRIVPAVKHINFSRHYRRRWGRSRYRFLLRQQALLIKADMKRDGVF